MDEFGDDIDDILPDFNAWANTLAPKIPQHFNDPNARTPAQISLHITEAQSALPIIHQLLTSSLELDHTIPGTAQLLATICKERLVSGDGEAARDVPEGIWFVLCDLIRKFAYHPFVATILCELLMALSKIEVQDGAGNALQAREDGKLFWRDLPGWNLAFRDNLIKLPPASYASQEEEMDGWEAEFRNANAFLSFWLAMCPEDECVDQRQFAASLGLQMLREALETKPAQDHHASVDRLLMYTSAVMPWIHDAGGVIWSLCKRGGTGQAVPEPAWTDEGVAGYDYQGEDGFNLARWNFWKSRLVQAGETMDTEEDVEQAAQKMEFWETEQEQTDEMSA